MSDFIEGLIRAFPFVGVLIALIFIDMLSGTVAALISKTLCSKISFSGVLKKFQIVMMVATGHIMELMYDEVPWGKVIALFFCGYELLSITENMSRCGVPLPRQLVEALKTVSSQYKKDSLNLTTIEVTLNADPSVDPAEVPPTSSKAVEVKK